MKKQMLIAAAALMGLGLTACGSSSSDVTVPVQSVSMLCGYSTAGSVDRFAGVVSPHSTVEIQKNEDSEIKELKVAAGDTVKKGQILFSYDGDSAQLDLETAQLELEQLKNSVDTKETQKAELEKDKKKASSSEKLSYSLQIQEMEIDIQKTQYDITAKEKEVQKLKDGLQNLDVVSTVDGVIQSINEDGGTDNYGNAKPYITISETGNYKVKGYVNENNASALTEGMSVIIRSRMDDTTWTGTLESVDWDDPQSSSSSDSYYYSGDTSDAETTASSKYPFYVELESIDGLILGQHVFIEPDYGQAEGTDEADEAVISISSAFINDADSKPWIWAESSKGKLEKRSVTLGDYDADLDTYVIADGLSLEDYIAYPDDSYAAGAACEEYDDSSYTDASADYGAEGVYSEGEYTEGEYSESEYTEGEFTEGEYTEGEYTEGEYTEGEYTEGEYTEGEYTEGGYTEDGMAEGDGVEETENDSAQAK